MGGRASDTRAAIQPPGVLLPSATPVEADALEELSAGDVVLHLLRHAAGRAAGELGYFVLFFLFLS